MEWAKERRSGCTLTVMWARPNDRSQRTGSRWSEPDTVPPDGSRVPELSTSIPVYSQPGEGAVARSALGVSARLDGR